ncbi:DUF3110 domain-containing protein [Pseudanabaena sp. PCC 6802]|uniref:DUF3110 domain-containing protein n=1 Tax=Pseudanabaena sp. PCC 6802 TaxID=118173 RepID=UPI0003469E45|nr:DUF3110 domain-containing protein [Pseudanabaena sp. PCC 6802]
MQLWVLLFNTDPDNQGIYARWEGGQNIVLAFTDEDDATRYSLMLEAQDFLCPQPEPIDEEELKAFCEEAGYRLEIVREDDLALPPERNLEETDWQSHSEDRDVNSLKSTARNDEADEIEIMRRRLEGLL